MSEKLQSPKLNKILAELRYLQFLRSFFNSIWLYSSIHPWLPRKYHLKCPSFRAWKAGHLWT